ncbi:hypothetical protein V8F20_002788 [Naviculisporaceae sp. PSN 640]
MGFREKIGLKPKASSINLSSAMNNGLGSGVGGGYPQQQQQQNMYSIPESGYAMPQQQHHQQPRTMGGIPFAMRPGPGAGGGGSGPQNSFEGTRSVSSGSAYSYTNGSTSTTSFATTNTSNTSSTHSSFGNGGLGANLRNFSGASSKSNLSSKTAQPQPQQYQPQEPTITAADVRRCTKLLRQMFELHLELWTLTYTHGTDQYRRHQKRMQVEAILVDIHNMVGAWHAMPPNTWSEEEYAEIQWIVSTLADLPPPPY